MNKVPEDWSLHQGRARPALASPALFSQLYTLQLLLLVINWYWTQTAWQDKQHEILCDFKFQVIGSLIMKSNDKQWPTTYMFVIFINFHQFYRYMFQIIVLLLFFIYNISDQVLIYFHLLHVLTFDFIEPNYCKQFVVANMTKACSI